MTGVAKKFKWLFVLKNVFGDCSCFYSFRSTFKVYFMIPADRSKTIMLANDILHDKHALKQILLETSVVVTNFIKN